MELLLGAGNSRFKKLQPPWVPTEFKDLVTVDIDPDCGADVVHDLDIVPWPFEDSMFAEVHAYDVLEHLGRQGDFRSFFLHFAEIYRILRPGGFLLATTPQWNSVWAWSDPGHTRVISPAALTFLNQAEYIAQIGKTAMTDYRWLWKGDFKLVFQQDVEDTHAWILQKHPLA